MEGLGCTVGWEHGFHNAGSAVDASICVCTTPPCPEEWLATHDARMLGRVWLTRLRKIPHRAGIKASNPFAWATSRVCSRPVEMNRCLALDVIGFKQDNCHSLKPPKALSCETRQRAESCEWHLRERRIRRVLNGIEISVDARQRHLCNLTFDMSGMTRLAGACPLDGGVRRLRGWQRLGV